MVLSKTDIQNLNRHMLNLGAPTERDDVGYNISDYNQMERYGRYLGELPSSVCVSILLSLKHYGNTQLQDDKDDIEESITHYKGVLFDRVTDLDDDPAKYISETIRVVGVCTMPDKLNGISFKFPRFYDVTPFRKSLHKPDAYKDVRFNSVTNTVDVKTEYVEDFLKDAKTREPYGYELDEEGKEFVKNCLEGLQKANADIQTEEEVKKHELKIVKVDQNGITLFFDGYLQDFQDFKKKVGRDHAKSVQINGEWHSFVSFQYKDELEKILDKNGYDITELVKVKPPEKETSKTGFDLVDYRKYPLPFTPYGYQLEDAKKIVAEKRMLLGHDMGCVSSSSIIHIRDEEGQGRPITVGNLKKVLEEKPLFIECLVNGVFAYFPIAKLLDKGMRKTLRIQTAATDLICTPDHEIYTDKGWVAAEKLSVGDCIVVKKAEGKLFHAQFEKKDADTISPTFKTRKAEARLEAVTAVWNAGEEHVYDIMIDDAFIHNFVCNEVVVHNCGKTFIATLVGESIPERKLVIVPESLRLNWRKEIRQVNPDADIKVLYSNDRFELGKDWTIIGYQTASKFEGELLSSNIKCIFVDEAHRCKAVNNMGQPSSKRAKAVIALCDKATYVYPMTGTPIPTSNRDMYNILRMLKAEEVITGDKWDFFKFGQRFCDGVNNGFGWDFTGNSNGTQLNAILSNHMVRRLKTDVLPDLEKQRIFIPIETKNREYKKLERNGVSDGNYLGFAMMGRRLLSKEKTAAGIDLAETILEQEKSVVIVSDFNESIDTIMEYFGDEACVIRGGMSDKDKEQSVTDFQSGKKKVCILNMIAGGVGITLTKASDMIICDYDWTPSNMSQVEDRINRAGQKNHCTIHYIYCENSVLDNLFMEMITSKSENIDKVIDGKDNTMDFNDKGKENKGYIQLLMDKYPPKQKKTRKKKKEDKEETTEEEKTEKE